MAVGRFLLTKLKKVCQETASVLAPRKDHCRIPDGTERGSPRDPMLVMCKNRQYFLKTGIPGICK